MTGEGLSYELYYSDIDIDTLLSHISIFCFTYKYILLLSHLYHILELLYNFIPDYLLLMMEKGAGLSTSCPPYVYTRPLDGKGDVLAIAAAVMEMSFFRAGDSLQNQSNPSRWSSF